MDSGGDPDGLRRRDLVRGMRFYGRPILHGRGSRWVGVGVMGRKKPVEKNQTKKKPDESGGTIQPTRPLEVEIRSRDYSRSIYIAPPPVKIPMLDYFKPPTRFHIAEVFAVSESGSKAVLSAAKFLLGVSSSLDGEPLRRCSGFWVDWDEDKKTGLVLTTAWLIRTKDSPDSGEEYAPRADVTVHLLNGTSAKGDLVYYQPHYDIAFLNIEVDQPIKLPSFCEEGVKFAEDVFRLGRDNSLNLRITYARAEYQNPNMYRRYHNVHFRSPDGHGDDNEYDNGGLAIDLKEKVVGMVNLPKRFWSFIPSSILFNCLDSWKKYRMTMGGQLLTWIEKLSEWSTSLRDLGFSYLLPFCSIVWIHGRNIS
ncbi:uncharacterized protein [Triticum aestivum]|uniref:uncharacterized protein isoform X3 n=1 Tax=Triticum aestivum TaxID=4565 RepID=UPI001D00D04F|nr:uncharacterized protein LOC123110068 isoform X3 [Triticum aestivum]XP_044386417.1 uncharacterized protein LOC123110068 isoform X3 [Triticum aestivum]